MCRCHDPAMFGHTDKNCGQAVAYGRDFEWQLLRFLHVPGPRPDPDGMTWCGTTWVRTTDLEAIR